MVLSQRNNARRRPLTPKRHNRGQASARLVPLPNCLPRSNELLNKRNRLPVRHFSRPQHLHRSHSHGLTPGLRSNRRPLRRAAGRDRGAGSRPQLAGARHRDLRADHRHQLDERGGREVLSAARLVLCVCG